MATKKEIKESLSILKKMAQNYNIKMYKAYPATENLNLSTIQDMKKTFKCW